MKRGKTIEYLKCRADLNFEVDFGVNGAIGTIVIRWDLILFGNGSFSSIIYIFLIRFMSRSIEFVQFDDFAGHQNFQRYLVCAYHKVPR